MKRSPVSLRFLFVAVLVLTIAIPNVPLAVSLTAWVMGVFGGESLSIATQDLAGYIKSETRGLVFVFLIFLYFELFRSSLPIRAQDIERLAQQVTSKLALLTYKDSLIRMYGAEQVDSVRSLIEPSKYSYRNAEVFIEIFLEEESSEIASQTTIDFETDSDELIFGFSCDQEATRLLLRDPAISELSTCPSEVIHNEKFLDDYLRSASLSVLYTDFNGGACRESIGIEETTIDELDHLSRLPDGFGLNYRLFKAVLPRAKGSQRRIIYSRNPTKISSGAPYWYWVVDRPMHIRAISIQVDKAILRMSKSCKVRWNTPPHEVLSGSLQSGKMRVAIGSWCFYGHGVVIGWK